MSRADDAVRIFREGQACSQAIVSAFAPSYGLEPGQALRIAAGFGSGMRIGGTCGAAIGSLMVLGLAFCDEGCAAPKGRETLVSAADEFLARFRERVGATNCPEIKGCVSAVRTAAEILEDMLGR